MSIINTKNVLFIGMTPNQGGLETFMINIFSRLEGHGFHFDFINAYNKPIAYTRFIKQHGGNIRHVHINRSHIGIFSRYYSAKKFFEAHHNYDIVHLNTLSLNNIYWLKAANKFSIPKLIIQSHDCNFIHNSRIVEYISKILSIWNRLFLKNSKVIELAVSDSAGKWMFHNKDFSVIKNGIDTEKFSYNKYENKLWRRKLHINNNTKVFITVAKITPQKNYSKIIKIFKFIHNLNKSTKLIIIGDGYEKSKIISLVKSFNLVDDVIFLGMVNNVNEILSTANLMIMPSKYEGFPFALVESQSAGVPAIVSSEAIPPSSNITNTLKYISLKKSNYIWAKLALEMTNEKFNKYMMNRLVTNSSYNINFLIDQIKRIYIK